MPRQPRGIGRLLTGAAHLAGSGITISILWVAIVIAVVGGIFHTIQAWDQPWRTLFWILFALLIFSLSVRLGLLIAARLKTAPGALGVGPAVVQSDTPSKTAAVPENGVAAGEATSQELTDLGNALRALSEDLINLFFDFQPTPAMTVPAEKEPELAKRYEDDFAERVVHHYDEARRRGFSDSEIERSYKSPNAFRSLARLAWRFGELAERVLVRAKG